MIVQVSPVDILKGSIRLPASKSYSIRSFMVAACGGVSHISYASNCEDALVSKQLASDLGAQVTKTQETCWSVDARKLNSLNTRFDVGESGTALRLLLPLLSLHQGTFQVDGRGTLKGRPNHFLTQALRQMGVSIKGKGSAESIPIRIDGGTMQPGEVVIDGSLSSQFISALMMACPSLNADTIIKISGGKIVSKDYLIMTQQILKEAGVHVKIGSAFKIHVPGKQKFKGLGHFTVPSDYGLAAFHLAAASLIPSAVTLKGHLTGKFVQADGHIMPFLKRLGVCVTETSKSLKVKGPFSIKGGQFSLRNCPDLVPIMAVMAMFAKKPTRLYDIYHARVKESDRISDLRNELIKVGADIQEKSDEILITPQKTYLSNKTLNPHHDHRLAMAFAVLGLKIGVKIKDMECCSKSYPDFVKDMRTLGGNVVQT